MPEFPLPPLTMVFLCFMVGLAGFVDSSAGGGGLIALPAYMAAGLPMHTVYACNKTSSAIGTTFSTLRFLKNGAADLKVGLLAAATSFLGAGLASQVVLLIPDAALRVVLLILLPVAAVTRTGPTGSRAPKSGSSPPLSGSSSGGTTASSGRGRGPSPSSPFPP